MVLGKVLSFSEWGTVQNFLKCLLLKFLYQRHLLFIQEVNKGYYKTNFISTEKHMPISQVAPQYFSKLSNFSMSEMDEVSQK